MAEVVNSLFGITPESLMAERELQVTGRLTLQEMQRQLLMPPMPQMLLMLTMRVL